MCAVYIYKVHINLINPIIPRTWSLWSDCSCECFGIAERSRRIARGSQCALGLGASKGRMKVGAVIPK